jgi:hypothetical protein
MSRTVPAAILTALAQPEVEPFYAVEVDLDSGPLRLWTGYGDRTIEGNVYTGGGDLMGISGLEEVADLSAKEITLTLSGIPSSVVSLALTEPYQRRKVRVLWGVRGETSVVEVFSGNLNQMVIEDGPDFGTITVTVDSRLVELERSSKRRYTSESHKTRYATDTFFDFVATIQDKQIQFEPR